MVQTHLATSSYVQVYRISATASNVAMEFPVGRMYPRISSETLRDPMMDPVVQER